MFIISPIFGLVAITLIVMLYITLLKRKLKAPFSDVRSGLFEAIAEWAAKKVKLLHGHADRAWKPSILLPLDSVERLSGVFRIVHDLAYPVGTVKLLGIQHKETVRAFEQELENSSAAYLKHGVFSSFSVMDEDSFPRGVIRGMQALRGAFFRPNILFLELPKNEKLHKELASIIEVAEYSKMGTTLIVYHPEAGLGKEERVNIWIPRPKSWELEMKLGNIDLAILLGYRLFDSWKGEIRVLSSVVSDEMIPKAREYLKRMCALARLPVAEIHVFVGSDTLSVIEKAPRADVTLTAFDDLSDITFLWEMQKRSGSTCIFCKDGGDENAFA